MNQLKAHRKIETEVLLKNFDLHREAKSFLFTLKSLSNIPMKDLNVGGGAEQPPAHGAKYGLEFYITLFNKELGNSKDSVSSGSFYGRTYRT